MTEHGDRAMDTGADLSRTAQRVAEAGLEAATKVAEYVRDGVDRTASYAQDVSGRASERIADVTGRSPEHWARQLRAFVEHSPFKAMAIAIAAGYLFARALRRS